ncbi:MAG: D-alanyl-D-alanine endopeptidase [Pseudomonadota bacterium]
MNLRLSLVVLWLCSSLLASNLGAVEKAVVKPAQELAAGSALVVDLQTDQVLYASNPDLLLPIASVTKLMTALVTLDAQLPLDAVLAVHISDTPEMKGVFSRVRVGTQVSRHDLLLMALMASENRAAASLAHHYPGGYAAFIAAMNAKAKALGMHSTRFVEPTGLSLSNVSTARDLVLLLKAAGDYPLLSELSTTSEQTLALGKPSYSLGFRNTNSLVRKADWSIQLSKTGYTDEAGRCLVMRAVMDGRPVAFVVLDAFGKYTPIADANRLRKWLETGQITPIPAAAKSYKQQRMAQRQLSANSEAALR